MHISKLKTHLEFTRIQSPSIVGRDHCLLTSPPCRRNNDDVRILWV